MTSPFHRIEVEVIAQDMLGESPIWHAGHVQWIDLRQARYHRFNPATSTHDTMRFEQPVGGIVPRTNGGIAAISSIGVELHDVPFGNPLLLATLEPDAPPDQRANDCTCDHHGRLWASTMADYGRATRGALYCVEPDGTYQKVRSDITVPNGLCCDPHRERLYFADSKVSVLEYLDLAEFAVGRATWVQLTAPGDLPGKADGATLDAEGHVWLACFGASCLVRISPNGQLVDTVILPVSQPTSCVFGGDEMRTLYVTSARQGLSEKQLAAEPDAGALLSFAPGVSGLPTMEFCG